MNRKDEFNSDLRSVLQRPTQSLSDLELIPVFRPASPPRVILVSALQRVAITYSPLVVEFRLPVVEINLILFVFDALATPRYSIC